jgi:hypothetical protein
MLQTNEDLRTKGWPRGRAELAGNTSRGGDFSTIHVIENTLPAPLSLSPAHLVTTSEQK